MSNYYTLIDQVRHCGRFKELDFDMTFLLNEMCCSWNNVADSMFNLELESSLKEKIDTCFDKCFDKCFNPSTLKLHYFIAYIYDMFRHCPTFEQMLEQDEPLRKIVLFLLPNK